jgi:peptidoglycan/LPS O-acetylase OafA/YrhL
VSPGTHRAEPHHGGGFRTDIQGLRALAVALVVVGHAGWLPGGYVGVDVFFVVSGFLITGLLLKKAECTGRVSIADFYARRARRILPAATLVALATLALGTVVYGEVRAAESVRDAAWAAVFAINWSLAADGADYFAGGADASPFQHYWSLAVEEQFYVVWPLLVLAVAVLLARRGRAAALRPVLAVVVTATIAASLAWSVQRTALEPGAAYFSTATRAWELAIGAGLALLVPLLLQLPAALRALLALGGLAGLAVAGVVIDETSAFPGALALLPVLATAALLAAGTGAEVPLVGRALAVPPVQWLGDRSYVLYLWHWPALVLLEARLGTEPSTLQVLGAVAAAVVAAELTHQLVEAPLHTGRLRPSRPMSLALWPASVAVLVSSVVALEQRYDLDSDLDYFAEVSQEQRSGGAYPSATRDPGRDVRTALARSDRPVPAELEPPLSQLRADTFHRTTPGRCYARDSGTTSHDVCTIGDRRGDVDVVVIGDSHAGMLLPGLDSIGRDRGWKIRHLVKTGCPTAWTRSGSSPDCDEWRAWAMDRIAELEPDIAIVSTMAEDDHGARWYAGMERTLTMLQSHAEDVVLIGETPWVPQDVDLVACLEAEGARLADCTVDLDPETVEITEAERRLTDELGVGFVDPTPWLCRDGRCPVVIDDQVVYYFRGHLTVTFVYRLARVLGDALAEEVSGRFR